jgi:hypothetical protein
MPIWSGCECVNVCRLWEKGGTGCCCAVPGAGSAGAKVGVIGLIGGPDGDEGRSLELADAAGRCGATSLVFIVSPGMFG